ncbi:hypothetical protein TRAPUB_606 [Trametes pubescens]|uniref:Uncharacterized protein n=1 Tax=Trametes pubescens TaxID=154538 RepID=A0A1M2VLI7_TRAPU|nr:hypothetical protein TRAPUB_606 [Trametes pubescens]
MPDPVEERESARKAIAEGVDDPTSVEAKAEIDYVVSAAVEIAYGDEGAHAKAAGRTVRFVRTEEVEDGAFAREAGNVHGVGDVRVREMEVGRARDGEAEIALVSKGTDVCAGWAEQGARSECNGSADSGAPEDLPQATVAQIERQGEQDSPTPK